MKAKLLFLLIFTFSLKASEGARSESSARKSFFQFRANLPPKLVGFLKEMCISASTHSIKSGEVIFESSFDHSEEVLLFSRLFIERKKPENKRRRRRLKRSARILATTFHYLNLRGCLTPEKKLLLSAQLLL